MLNVVLVPLIFHSVPHCLCKETRPKEGRRQETVICITNSFTSTSSSKYTRSDRKKNAIVFSDERSGEKLVAVFFFRDQGEEVDRLTYNIQYTCKIQQPRLPPKPRLLVCYDEHYTIISQHYALKNAYHRLLPTILFILNPNFFFHCF